MNINHDLATIGEEDLRNIGQIVFSLLVGRFDAAKRLKEFVRFKAIDSRVDFPNLTLLRSSVLVFNNSRERVLSIANHTAVSRRILEPNTQNRTVGASCTVVSYEFLQGVSSYQWDIAGKHQ